MTLADVLNRLEEANLIMFTDDEEGKPPITSWLDDAGIDPETPIPVWNEQTQAWEVEA